MPLTSPCVRRSNSATTATIRGRKAIRVAITNHRTRREDLELPAGGLATDRKVADWAQAAKLAIESAEQAGVLTHDQAQQYLSQLG